MPERGRGEKKGPDDGACRGRVFHPTDHSGDVQQVHPPMPEEVRPQYGDVVIKPLDIGANIFASLWMNRHKQLSEDK
jgi:hypothetical protein